MLQLVYTSVSTAEYSEPAMTALLESARRHNAAAQITGALVYREGCFLQVLEGPAGAVQALMQRILRDGRHHEVLEIDRRLVDARSFGAWTMNYTKLSPDDVLPNGQPSPQRRNLEKLLMARHSADSMADPVNLLVQFLAAHDGLPLDRAGRV